MPLIGQSGRDTAAPKVDWADPGYFAGSSVVGNTVRVLVQLISPPKGHRTLPTKTGSMLILITIGVGTAAFNTGQNILYLALSMMLSTLLVSGLLSWINFKGCRWRLEAGRHFRVGEESPVYLQLENTKRWLPSYDLMFKLSAVLSGVRKNLFLNQRLDRQGKTSLLWEFIPGQRGEETIRLEGLLSRYPFGFLKKTIRDSYAKTVLVWPARIPYQFSGQKAGRRWLYGHHRRKGEGVDLIHVRGYRSGDPLRRIHWKATAKLGSLQVRETEQEHHQAFALFVDPSPNLWADAAQFEKLCSFAASLAEDLFQHDQLRTVQVAGQAKQKIGAIDDLYAFLDTLSGLERKPHEPGSGSVAVPLDTVTFLPGPNRVVIANLEGQHVGQA
jgi:uncharacterized protein (DUF58 family)